MIETERLVLRPWREADKPRFHDIINTPAMMAHFGGVAPREKIDALIDRLIEGQARDGHTMWALDHKRDNDLVGVCGVRLSGHPGTGVADELEIGWRVAEHYWGQGIAREAAQASLDWSWANTDRARVAAWTREGNLRSVGLMKRLGMVRRADLDFHHPQYEPGNPLGEMIVYTIDRPAA